VIALAGTTAGPHRSADGGRSWVTTTSGSPLPFVEALAPSPGFATDRTVFAGTRQGVYRSTDVGATWQPVLVGSRVLALVPTGAALFAGTETDGVLRSEDGGRGWTGANAGLLDLAVLALAFSPRFETDATGFAATASGLYRSRNGGKSWRAVDLPLDDPAVQCLAVSPAFADDRLVLAGTEEAGLLRSDDGGARWELVDGLSDEGVTAVSFSTGYAGRPLVAAATGRGVAISQDGGARWSLAELGPVLSLAFVPDGDGEVLLAGLVGRGILRSADGGATWTPADDGPRANLLGALAVSPGFADDRTLFAGGLEDGVTVSVDGGATWEPRNDGLDDTTVMGLAVSPDYARDRTLIAATGSGLYRSDDAAATWRPVLREAIPTTLGAIAAVSTGAGRPARVLAAVVGGQLLASDDVGESWRSLGEPFDGEVISIAASPQYARDRTLFVGVAHRLDDEGVGELALWRSTDGGARWQRWLEARGQSVLPICALANDLCLVGLGGSVLRPLRAAQEIVRGARRPIWRSADLVQHPDAVTALVASPNFTEDRTVVAATSAGVYISRDGGERFTPYGEGLTPPSILTLTISPAYARDGLLFAVGVDGTIWQRSRR
jgi:hypothetical protein